MKKLLFATLLLSTCSLYANVSTPTSTTATKSPAVAPGQATAPQNAPPPPPVVRPLINQGSSKPAVHRPIASKQDAADAANAAPTTVTFTLPGIIGIQEGDWKGSDDLLNLTNNIFVSADIVASKDLKLPFSSDSVKARVEASFVKAGLHPDGPTATDHPPLPYLHFVIMVQPCGDDVAAFIQVRLFEKVKLDRVILPNEVTYQAITWEDENFIVMARSQLGEEVLKQVDEMTDYFVERFNFFEKETLRTKGK